MGEGDEAIDRNAMEGRAGVLADMRGGLVQRVLPDLEGGALADTGLRSEEHI